MGRQLPPPDWSALPERELEGHYVGGDEAAAGAALAELLGRYSGSLWQQARRQGFGDEDLAQEALADTRVKLWQYRRRYELGSAPPPEAPPRSRWRSWAGTVLHRTILDRLRRAGAEWGTLPASGAESRRPRPRRVAVTDDDFLARLDSKASSPDEENTLAERRAAVLDCLQRLKQTKQPHFEVLILYYWSGRTQQEIADQLQVVVSTVCKRLETGREFLRDCLNRHHPEVTDDR